MRLALYVPTYVVLHILNERNINKIDEILVPGRKEKPFTPERHQNDAKVLVLGFYHLQGCT